MKKFSYKPSVIESEHYVLGAVSSVPKVVLRPTGSWMDVLPPPEVQNKGFETYDCTAFGLLKDVEILGKIQGYNFELSERFMGIVAGTTPQSEGNDPHTVAEALRHYGAIAEADLPFDDGIKNIQEFYSFKGNDEQTCRDAGENFTEAWTFLHEWVFTSPSAANKTSLLKEAITYSPIGVAGFAWQKDPATGLYISPAGSPYCHWFTIVDYVDGQYWVVDDSYLEDGSPIKHLAWDYDFACAKRYYFVKNPVWKKPTWFQGILNFLGIK